MSSLACWIMLNNAKRDFMSAVLNVHGSCKRKTLIKEQIQMFCRYYFHCSPWVKSSIFFLRFVVQVSHSIMIYVTLIYKHVMIFWKIKMLIKWQYKRQKTIRNTCTNYSYLHIRIKNDLVKTLAIAAKFVILVFYKLVTTDTRPCFRVVLYSRKFR